MENKVPHREKQVNKHQFLKILRKEAKFTISDTNFFWNAFQEIIIRILREGKEVNLSGFGKFYVKNIEPHSAWDQVHKVWYDKPASRRIVFKLSSTFKNALIQELDEKQREIEEES